MLNELLKSRHYRLKVECLILLIYTMFECNGLIWLTSMHLDFESEDHINLFVDETFTGLGVACVFSLASVLLFWIFAIRIILHYYYKEKDLKWMKCTKLFAKIACILWILSMLTWTITIIFTDIAWLLKLGLAFIPAWNKSLCIGIIYSIFYEFNPAVSRTQRVVRWISIVTIYLSVYVVIMSMFCGISWLVWAYSLMDLYNSFPIVSIYMFFISIVLTPFYNFFFILWDQLRPHFEFKYYMICIPCCCGCFCHDEWCRCCVPRCCIGRPDVKISTWLIIGMSFVWIVCTVFANDNECLAEASLIEGAFGFRGAAILVLLFSVLINIELTYSGEVKNRYIDDDNIRSVADDVSLQVAAVTESHPGVVVLESNVKNKDNDGGEEEDEEDDLTVR